MYVDPFFLQLVSFLTEKSFLLLSGLGKESFPVLWEANMKKKKELGASFQYGPFTSSPFPCNTYPPLTFPSGTDSKSFVMHSVQKQNLQSSA
jgi:hypothetical protein